MTKSRSQKRGRPRTNNAKAKISLRLPLSLLMWIDSQNGDRTEIITSILQKEKGLQQNE